MLAVDQEKLERKDGRASRFSRKGNYSLSIKAILPSHGLHYFLDTFTLFNIEMLQIRLQNIPLARKWNSY